MKRTALYPALLFCAASVMAGDSAVLDNLGFSSDGRYFMFGQHVLVTDDGQAYAEAGIVDTERNVFVSGGWKKITRDVPMDPSLDSRGGLYEVLADLSDAVSRYRINHLEQGRMLYTLSADSEENESEPESLTFRDFERGREYTVDLYQDQADGNGASFYIDLSVTDSRGRTQNYRAGREGYSRRGVAGYQIVRVWRGPDGDSLVIAVLKKYEDLSIRYMVETLVLN